MDKQEEVLTAQCEICGAEFRSLYPKQLKQFVDSHMQTHDIEEQDEEQ